MLQGLEMVHSNNSLKVIIFHPLHLKVSNLHGFFQLITLVQVLEMTWGGKLFLSQVLIVIQRNLLLISLIHSWIERACGKTCYSCQGFEDVDDNSHTYVLMFMFSPTVMKIKTCTHFMVDVVLSWSITKHKRRIHNIGMGMLRWLDWIVYFTQHAHVHMLEQVRRRMNKLCSMSISLKFHMQFDDVYCI